MLGEAALVKPQELPATLVTINLDNLGRHLFVRARTHDVIKWRIVTPLVRVRYKDNGFAFSSLSSHALHHVVDLLRLAD